MGRDSDHSPSERKRKKSKKKEKKHKKKKSRSSKTKSKKYSSRSRSRSASVKVKRKKYRHSRSRSPPRRSPSPPPKRASKKYASPEKDFTTEKKRMVKNEKYASMSPEPKRKRKRASSSAERPTKKRKKTKQKTKRSTLRDESPEVIDSYGDNDYKQERMRGSLLNSLKSKVQTHRQKRGIESSSSASLSRFRMDKSEDRDEVKKVKTKSEESRYSTRSEDRYYESSRRRSNTLTQNNNNSNHSQPLSHNNRVDETSLSLPSHRSASNPDPMSSSIPSTTTSLPGSTTTTPSSPSASTNSSLPSSKSIHEFHTTITPPPEGPPIAPSRGKVKLLRAGKKMKKRNTTKIKFKKQRNKSKPMMTIAPINPPVAETPVETSSPRQESPITPVPVNLRQSVYAMSGTNELLAKFTKGKFQTQAQIDKLKHEELEKQRAKDLEEQRKQEEENRIKREEEEKRLQEEKERLEKLEEETRFKEEEERKRLEEEQRKEEQEKIKEQTQAKLQQLMREQQQQQEQQRQLQQRQQQVTASVMQPGAHPIIPNFPHLRFNLQGGMIPNALSPILMNQKLLAARQQAPTAYPPQHNLSPAGQMPKPPIKQFPPNQLQQYPAPNSSFRPGGAPPANQMNQFPPANQMNQFPPTNQMNQFPPANQMKQFPPANRMNQFPLANQMKQFPPTNQLNQFPATNQLAPQFTNQLTPVVTNQSFPQQTIPPSPNNSFPLTQIPQLIPHPRLQPLPQQHLPGVLPNGLQPLNSIVPRLQSNVGHPQLPQPQIQMNNNGFGNNADLQGRRRRSRSDSRDRRDRRRKRSSSRDRHDRSYDRGRHRRRSRSRSRSNDRDYGRGRHRRHSPEYHKRRSPARSFQRRKFPDKSYLGVEEAPSRETYPLPITTEGTMKKNWVPVLHDEKKRSYAAYCKNPFPTEKLDKWFEIAETGIAWDQPEVNGKKLNRRAAFLVEKGCKCNYRYSNTRWDPQEMPEWFTQITKEVMEEVGIDCPSLPNSCNVNYYNDGRHSVGWHADNEPVFKSTTNDCLIISLSLGASRNFQFQKQWQQNTSTETIELRNGDLMTMEGLFQRYYSHRVPMEHQCTKPRINFTWRWITNHYNNQDGCPKQNTAPPVGHSFDSYYYQLKNQRR